jgi:hypothetical protein
MPIEQLTAFYKRMEEDNRMSPAHISVYMALWERWNRVDFTGPVIFTRRELMRAAKISGLATYHRCMKDLATYGYIEYRPSFNPCVGSQAIML